MLFEVLAQIMFLIYDIAKLACPCDLWCHLRLHIIGTTLASYANINCCNIQHAVLLKVAFPVGYAHSYLIKVEMKL